MASTKKPSGLSIARNGLKFTISWKIADSDYGEGQQLQWRIWTGKWSAWTAITIGTQTTTASKAFSASGFFPVTGTYFYGIQFRIRGKRNKTSSKGETTQYSWSDWAEKTMDLTVPAAPTVSASLHDTLDNVTRFTWSAPNSSTDLKPFHSVEWQSILVKESNETDGSKLNWKSTTLGWQTGTGGANSSKSITEETTLLAANSYTRWFRVRARGCGGNGDIKGCSYWKYAKHVYARPYKPVINKASKENTNWIRVNWTAASAASHPIDSIDVDYVIDTPLANQAPPDSLRWNTVRTFKDTEGTDEAFFQVTDAVGTDKCLWARVNAHHDREGNSRESDPVIVVRGPLAAPTGLSVVTNSTTYMATVTATNNSDVPDAEMAIVFRRKGSDDIIVGYIPHGETSATVKCPNWSDGVPVQFGVFAYQGNRTEQSAISTHGESTSTAKTYSVEANMKSSTLWAGGTVPVEPSGANASRSETEGEVILTWGWAWSSANRAELSWSDNPNAWESTDEPSSYMVTNLNTAKWRVSGLAIGKTWYFRIRLAQETDSGITYGPYCDTMPVDLSATPSAPVLTLTEAVIQAGGIFTAAWNYLASDGSQQSYAEICEASYTGGTVTYGSIIAHTKTEHQADITVPVGWTTGSTHYLCVRVTSETGRTSEWSDPAAITIADPLAIAITQTSLTLDTIDDGAGDTRSVLALKTMPFTITVTGAGAGGTTTVTIERAASYILDRPDESRFTGYEGETVYSMSQSGEGQITINKEDLTGLLDDGAPYRLTATIRDDYGQSDTAQIEFEVHWTHQAVMPEGTASINRYNVAVIRPIAPEDFEEGDTCDVYRLSADAPVMVLKDAQFGETYVDPYPAIGDTGGYRFVYKTENGDYITEENQIAWLDVRAGVESALTIIDFDGHQIILEYDMEISNSWEKEFTETTYLGGSVQGDWNLATHRRASVSADTVVTDDPELIAMMRRLAVYPGICHVRTADGSSFAANVEVSEKRTYEQAGKIAVFELTINRVDEETLDGVLYAEYYPGATA